MPAASHTSHVVISEVAILGSPLQTARHKTGDEVHGQGEALRFAEELAVGILRRRATEAFYIQLKMGGIAPMKKRDVSILALIGALLLTAVSSDAQLDLYGSVGYWRIGSTITLNVQYVENYGPSYSTSGTLALQLWATASPYSSGQIYGYKVGETILGTLQGGYYWANISRSVTYYQPPNGTYYITMVLAEWNGSNFVTVDHHTFSATETVGPPPINFILSVRSFNPVSGVSITGSHPGSTGYDRTLLEGTAVTLTAPLYHGISGARKRFENWSGDMWSPNRTISLSMYGNSSVTANYVNDPEIFTLNLLRVGNGQARVNGTLHALPWSDTFMGGTSVALEAIPDEGWLLRRWSGDLTGCANPSSIIMDGHGSITVDFAPYFPWEMFIPQLNH